MVHRSLSQTRCLQCISVANSFNQQWYQGGSLSMCSDGNIILSLGWTSWSTTVAVIGVLVVGVVGVVQHFTADVEAVLEVVELLMEALCLYAVSDPLQSLIFTLNFGDNGTLVCFKLATSVVVVVVSLNFHIGSGVIEGMGCFSQ